MKSRTGFKRLRSCQHPFKDHRSGLTNSTVYSVLWGPGQEIMVATVRANLSFYSTE